MSGEQALGIPPPASLSVQVSLRLAVFDVDRTLLPGSSLVELGRILLDRGLIARRDLVSASVRDQRFRRRGSTDAQVDRLARHALQLLRGRQSKPFEDAAVAAAERVVRRVTPAARLLLERHLAAGDFCVLLSAAPQPLVTRTALLLGAQRGVGTRAEVVDGVFTGRLIGPLCYGPGKLERLEREIGSVDLAQAAAYADSASDLPLLEACGRPVAINPDRALERRARAANWPIFRI